MPITREALDMPDTQHPTFTQMYLKAGNGMATSTFTVPAGVTAILIEAWSGGGGGAPGLYYRAVVSMIPGTHLVLSGAGGTVGTGGSGLTRSNGVNGKGWRQQRYFRERCGHFYCAWPRRGAGGEGAGVQVAGGAAGTAPYP